MEEYYNNQNEQHSGQTNPNYAQSVNRPVKKQKKSSGTFGKIVAGAFIGMAFGVMAAVSFSGVTRLIDKVFPKTEASTKTEATVSEPKEIEEEKKTESIEKVETVSSADTSDKTIINTSTGMDVSTIVDNNMPCIVSITNKSVQEVMSMWGMGVREYESTSAGSGIIIGENEDEILIATNNHVVEDADTLSVGFVDEGIYSANIKGTDSDIDLAVVAVKKSEISDETLKSIKIAILGESGNLKVGEQVVAIGNALGYGQSVTTGIVSALDRDITDNDIDDALIQTDAAINPGNSGGALFNMNGELIGINRAKINATSVEGVGYAIPIDCARPIIETLMNRQIREEVDEKEAGYLGITGVSVDSSTSKMYGIPEGVYLQTVEEDSPADEAGLIKGDVIRKFDGVTLSSIADIRNKLDYYKAGEDVDLDIYRLEDGEYTEKTITVTLGSRKGTSLDPDKQKDEGFGSEDSDKDKSSSGVENGDGDSEDDESSDGFLTDRDAILEYFFGR